MCDHKNVHINKIRPIRYFDKMAYHFEPGLMNSILNR
eukprot:UN04488